MNAETIVLNAERNVTLTAYTQSVGGKFANISKRPAMLVLPGGAYMRHCDREADPVAFPYLAAGFQTFVLRYSVAQHAVWPNPLTDVEQALEMIRTREDWNVLPDKVAVVGFSAGGHLAAAAATMAKDRPNAAVIGYGAVGETVTGCCPSAPDTVPYVDGHTCPCFVFSSRTDPLVPIRNSLDFLTALANHNVAFESHIYAFGPHGFATADNAARELGKPMCDRIPHWVDDSIGWLRDMFGEFGDGVLTEPRCRAHFTDDNEPVLSVGCTLGHLMANEAAVRVLQPLFERAGAAGFQDLSKSADVMADMMLRYAGLSDAEIAEVDAKLHTIRNETV